MDSFEKGQAMFPAKHKGALHTPPELDTLHHVNKAEGAPNDAAEAASSHAPFAKIHTHTEHKI
jgi:hypothetical protein